MTICRPGEEASVSHVKISTLCDFQWTEDLWPSNEGRSPLHFGVDSGRLHYICNPSSPMDFSTESRAFCSRLFEGDKRPSNASLSLLSGRRIFDFARALWIGKNGLIVAAGRTNDRSLVWVRRPRPGRARVCWLSLLARPTMRFVPLKTEEQLDVQTIDAI
jgi:hypothetical protein